MSSDYYTEYLTGLKGISRLRRDYDHKLYTYMIFNMDAFVSSAIESWRSYGFSKKSVLYPGAVKIKVVCYAFTYSLGDMVYTEPLNRRLAFKRI